MRLRSDKYRLVTPRAKPGQATVEFALVLGLLVLLLIGVADVARIFSEHLSAVHAAGVGARWLILDPNNRACSQLNDLEAIVRTDLDESISAANILSITGSFQSDPPAVRVDVTYRHDYLFGLLHGLPGTFTGSATMPGTHAAGTGSCPTPPVPSPTSTPLTIPTDTPVPASPTPTGTPTPGVALTPSATSTPCAGHGLLASTATACDLGSGWTASISAQGFVAGDSVRIERRRSNGTLLEWADISNCPGGVCSYTSSTPPSNSGNDTVTFTLTPAPGSCPAAITVVGPIALPPCAAPTSTPSPAVPSATATSTPTLMPPTATRTSTTTSTPTRTVTPAIPACPISASVTAYKPNGNNTLLVRVVVTSGGNPVAGSSVTVRVGTENLTSATNAFGVACLTSAIGYSGQSVSGTIDVAHPACPIAGQPFTSSTNSITCP